MELLVYFGICEPENCNSKNKKLLPTKNTHIKRKRSKLYASAFLSYLV